MNQYTFTFESGAIVQAQDCSMLDALHEANKNLREVCPKLNHQVITVTEFGFTYFPN